MNKGYMSSEYYFNSMTEKFVYNLDDALRLIKKKIKSRSAFTIFSLNLHALSNIQRNYMYKEAVSKADALRFDGLMAIKYVNYFVSNRKIEKVSAHKLMNDLYENLPSSASYYFLGGEKGVAEQAANNINNIFPCVNVVGTRSGYFDDIEEKKILIDINNKSPDVLLVGLGMPLQENWICQNKERINVGVVISCGGYIEQVSETGIEYFPEWGYRLGLNWLYRIIKEPRRMIKRYVFDFLIFIIWLVKEIIRTEN